jgi:Raf kinase inhibitor-like YbhB/YbcL family protein
MASEPATLTVTSPLFSDGETIPPSAAHQMASGENVSPGLRWTAVPPGTASIVVTCYDPDAPTTVGFVHWVLFNLDPATTELPAGAGVGDQSPAGSVHGHTDWGANEYGGMAPPPGDPPHHYQFRVYALDTRLDAGPTTTYALLNFMMRGHILAQGMLTGLYAT